MSSRSRRSELGERRKRLNKSIHDSVIVFEFSLGAPFPTGSFLLGRLDFTMECEKAHDASEK
jgi:hypothetical protein